ncbi:crt homolog 3-like [Mytilus edulis]|uniref:Uncharacterized protein n=2 Tax=Mytilus TaxID=6548 RepID=A0A8S3T5K5_MYTED|nr:unnamed protein product [Mytilus edulis]
MNNYERDPLLVNSDDEKRSKLVQAAWSSKKTTNSRFSAKTRNLLIAVMNVFSNVLMNVSLPVYAGTMEAIGSDIFVLLFITCCSIAVVFTLLTLFVKYSKIDSTATLRPTSSYKILFMMGLFTAMNGILVVYASPPNRTPPYLQGILQSSVIPFTVLLRLVILRKGISIVRGICTMIVLVGIFITIEPQIWGLDADAGETGSKPESTGARILWPFCFLMGFLPVGLMNVFCEKELQKEEGQSFSFITWGQYFQTAIMVCFFWVDFVPGFGSSSSGKDFFHRLQKGLHCSFSTESSCNNLGGKAWLFYTGYTFGNLFQFLLIQYAEGAVYAVVVQALVSPIAALFWNLFQYNPQTDVFQYKPTMDTTTAFTFGGLLLIFPGVILYNYFSGKEGSEKVQNQELEVHA